MKYQRFLQLYKASLRLYPAPFRSRHGEQIYLTAQDMLQNVPTTRAAIQLASDTCLSLLVEHAKQLKGNSMSQQRKSIVAMVGDSVWIGVQITMLPLLVYASIRPIIHTYPLLVFEGQPIPFMVENAVLGLMPLILAALAFWLLGALGLKLWSRILSSLVIACATTGAFNWLFGMPAVQMWRYQMVSTFGSLWVLADLLLLGMYLTGFYLVGMRVVGRLKLQPTKRVA
jgi:hypothetical protein